MKKKLPTGRYKGFTIIELLMNMGIIAVLTTLFFINFRSSASNAAARHQQSAIIVADLRRAQAMATAGSRYQGSIVCGFGIHYVSSSRYYIYAKMAPTFPTACSAVTTRNYEATDYIVEQKGMINSNFVISGAFSDIFFEPPDPKTYINNVHSLNPVTSTNIRVVRTTSGCVPAQCTTINITTAGKIDVTN